MHENDFKEIYSRFLSSGLSVKDFCYNEDLLESRFYYWQKKLKSVLPSKQPGFIPLVITNSASSGSLPCDNEPLQTLPGFSPERVKPLTCDISFPNGISLRIKGDVDCEFIRQLLMLK